MALRMAAGLAKFREVLLNEEKPHGKTGTPSWKARLTLLAAYLLLAALVVWAATAPLTRFTGTLTALLVLGSWVPGYIYANWHDIRSNRVFWISNGLALVVTASLWLTLMPRSIEA